MGKRIITRARGRGGPRYRSPGHRFAGEVCYPEKGFVVVKDIIHDPGRDAPLAVVETKEKKKKFIIVAEGTKVGDIISIGEAEAKTGNILPLANMPKGASVFAIETFPCSGPKLCCSAGSHAFVISHEADKVILKMSSGAFKAFNPNCLATLGIPAGGGRFEKPFIKAGQIFYAMRARNELWPRTSANKMNPVDHPFGGKTKPGTPKSVSRRAPPGAKVGSLASRRTGRKKA